MTRFSLILGMTLVICGILQTRAAENPTYVDVRNPASLRFQGTLEFRIIPGAPNYEDVRKGDTPEPTYVLRLDTPICAFGDDFLDPKEKIDRVHISAEGMRLKGLVGRRITIKGSEAFGAHTGHHHAPLVMIVKSVSKASKPARRQK